MKKLIVEDLNEGLESLIGQRITLFCMNYFYTGDLIGVNDTDVLLADAHIIYETGPWTEGKWEDAQRVADKMYVRTAAIEAYAVIW